MSYLTNKNGAAALRYDVGIFWSIIGLWDFYSKTVPRSIKGVVR